MTNVTQRMRKIRLDPYLPEIHGWLVGQDAYESYKQVLEDHHLVPLTPKLPGDELLDLGFKPETVYLFQGMPVILDDNLEPDMVKAIPKDLWDKIHALQTSR